MLKRKPPGEGAMPNRREIWLFHGVNMDEICWNFSGRILTLRPTISTRIHTLQTLQCYEQACKNPSSGLRGCYVLWSSKKRVTCKQNLSTTVGKSRPGLPSLVATDDGHPDSLLSFLPMTASFCSSHFLPWTLRPSLGDSITKVWPEIERLSDIFVATPFISTSHVTSKLNPKTLALRIL